MNTVLLLQLFNSQFSALFCSISHDSRCSFYRYQVSCTAALRAKVNTLPLRLLNLQNSQFSALSCKLRDALFTEISSKIFMLASFRFAWQFNAGLPDSLSRMSATVMAWSCAIFSAVITCRLSVIDGRPASLVCLNPPPPSLGK